MEITLCTFCDCLLFAIFLHVEKIVAWSLPEAGPLRKLLRWQQKPAGIHEWNSFLAATCHSPVWMIGIEGPPPTGAELTGIWPKTQQRVTRGIENENMNLHELTLQTLFVWSKHPAATCTYNSSLVYRRGHGCMKINLRVRPLGAAEFSICLELHQ